MNDTPYDVINMSHLCNRNVLSRTLNYGRCCCVEYVCVTLSLSIVDVLNRTLIFNIIKLLRCALSPRQLVIEPTQHADATTIMIISTRRWIQPPLCVCKSITRKLTHARQHASQVGQRWNYSRSTTKVADAEILDYASQPLHALSLRDLVKYFYHSEQTSGSDDAIDMVDHHSPPRRSSLLRISPSHSSRLDWLIVYKLYEICLS